MVYRYLLRSIFLLFILLISANSLLAQEKEIPGGKDLQQIIKEADKALKEGRFSDYVQLVGAMGFINCLDPTYCSNTTSSIKLEPNSDWSILGSTVRLDWEIIHEGTPVSGVITSSGSGMSTEFYFHPYLVPVNLQGKSLVVHVYQLNSQNFAGTSMSDIITVLKSPSVYDFSFDDGSLTKEICFGENATLTLPNSEDNVRYSLFRNGSFSALKDGSTGNAISFTITESGTYTLNAANVGYGCPEMMNGAPELTVNPSPTPTITPISPICEGETIELRGKPDGMVFYSWTGPGIATSLDGQDQDLTDATKATHEGTYYLLVQDANGCEGSASINVVVNESPDVLLNNPGPFCEGDVATLTATASNGTAPYSYAWYKAGVLIPGETASTLSFNPVSIVDAGDYSVIVSDAKNCATTEISTTLEVNESPVITPINYSGDKCAGEVFTLSTSASGGTGANTYSWTLDGAPLGGNSSSITLPALSAGTYTVSVFVSSGGCTSNTESQNVVVKPTPVADLQGGSICLGGTETFDASATTGATNYEFILDGTTVQSSPSNTYGYTPTVADIGSHALVMVASNADGCADSKTLEFEVYPEPTATIAFADSEICSGSPVDLTFTLTTGSTPWSVTYNDGTTDITRNYIAGSSYTISVSPTSDVTYTLVSVTDANGCAITPGTTASLVVKDSPTVNISGDAVVCFGESLTLNAAATGGSGTYAQYNWFKDGVALLGTSSTYSVPATSSLDAGSYTVTVVDNNTCESTSAAFDVVVQEATATLTTPNTSVCAGTPVTFTAGGAGLTGSYTFFVNGSQVQAPSPNNEYTTSSLSDNDEVLVKIVDDNGCEASASVTMTVFSAPTATVALSDSEICAGSSVDLTFTLTTGTRPWNLTYNDGTEDIIRNSIAGSSYTISVSPTSDVTYTLVSISDANGCEAADEIKTSVTVHPVPLIELTAVPSSKVAKGTPIEFTAIGGEEYSFFHNGVEVKPRGSSDNWNLVDPADEDEVVVVGWSLFSCESSDRIVVNVGDNPQVFDLKSDRDYYCENENGVKLYLDGSEDNVDYRLYETSDLDNPVGIAEVENGLIVWKNILEGKYQVVATRTTGLELSITFPRVVTITEEPVPDLFNMTPDGELTECPATISLDGSKSGIDYYLYLDDNSFGEKVEGDDNPLEMGSHSIGGVYTIKAFHSLTGCSSSMNGELELVVPDGEKFDLTSDPVGGSYCEGGEGVTLNLSGSEKDKIYTVYFNESATDTIVVGDGVPISFGPFTKVGSYRVVTPAQGGCELAMNGVVVVSISPLPTTFDLQAENGGHFCEDDADGVGITQVGQQAGVSYQLWLDGIKQGDAQEGTVNSASATLYYDKYTIPGKYTVIGTNLLSGCENEIGTVTLTKNPLPEKFEIGGDTDYCDDGVSTASISLSGSQEGLYYKLYSLVGDVRTDLKDSKVGTGESIDFAGVEEGDYIVIASSEPYPGLACEEEMGTVVISKNPMPKTDLIVTPPDTSGDKCNVTATITIDDAEDGAEYEIYWWENDNSNGSIGIIENELTSSGDIVFSNLSFDGNGKYRIHVRLGSCEDFLDNGFTISGASITKYSITGDGAICEGDTEGVNIGLSSSEPDVTYVLWSVNAGVGPAGADVPIDTIKTDYAGYVAGEALDFGKFNEEGDYIIKASNVDCVDVEMFGMVKLRFNPLPIAFQITGSGVFCGDAKGAVIGLDGSEEGVSYTLVWHDGDISRIQGDPLVGRADGKGITFPDASKEGEYTVYARSEFGCTSSMNGSVVVETKDTPSTDKEVKVSPESGIYCSNESVVSVEITHPDAGVTYSLVDTLTNEVISFKEAKNVNPIVLSAFDLSDDGTGTIYKLIASYAKRGCESPIDTINVVRNASPGKPVVIFPGVDTLVVNVCSSDSYFHFEKLPDVTYVVYLDGSPKDTIPANDDLTSDYSYAIEESGFVSVEASYDFSCPQMSKVSYFNIYPSVASFNLSVSNSGYHCEGDGGAVITIEPTVAGVYYELYKVGDINPIAIIKGDDSEKPFIPVPGTSDGISYEVKVDDKGGCTSGSTQELTVFEVPLPDRSKKLLTESSVGGTKIILENSEAPRSGTLWKDSVYYELFIETKVDYPSLGSKIGTGENLNLGESSESGTAEVVATRYWYVNNDSIIGCSSEPFGSIGVGEYLLTADTIYLYLHEGKNVVSTNMGQYIKPDSTIIDRSELTFNFVAPFLSEDDFHWFPPDSIDSGSTSKKLNLVKGLHDTNVLGVLNIHGVDSITFSRKVSNLYGIASVKYIVEHELTGQSDTAKITLIIGNVEGMEGTTFILPNAFSPNGDGINDYFVIDGLQNFKGVGEKPLSTLEVFNRWGTVVYQSKGLWYGKDNAWWDGTSNTGTMVSIGKELPNGTYYYVFTVEFYKGDRKVKKAFPGFVELRR